MLTPETVRRKLEHLQPTQESVETVSLWCLHHKESAGLIVSSWLQVFKNAASEKQRLSLFYLANDVCQKGRKKKGQEYLTHFVPALKEAILFSRHESIKQNIDRILNIWGERNVFEAGTINEFKSVLESSGPSGNNNTNAISATEPRAQASDNEAVMTDFSLSNLTGEAERYQKSANTVERMRVLMPSTSFATDGNAKALLKSRQEGQRVIEDINQTHKKWSEFVDECERRLKRHHQLVIALERANIFYETQLNEAGIVQTAYEKFGAGVKAVRHKLTKMQRTGNYNYTGSPINSPSSFDDSFSITSGTGAAPKKDTDKMEAVDMDLDDDVKFSGTPNSTRPAAPQETAIEGMKLATNQSFLNNPPAMVASNGASFSVEAPSKKAKLDPRQQKAPQPTPAEGTIARTLYPATAASAPSSTMPAPSSWPSDLTPQHLSPPANTYPGFGSSVNVQSPSSLQSPPSFLSQPPPPVHYPMQHHHPSYGGVMPLPPPPPPPHQSISGPPFPGNHAYPATSSGEVGTVYDYDHGVSGVPTPSVPFPVPNNRGSHFDSMVPDSRTHRHHPPDPQYFEPPPQAFGGPRHVGSHKPQQHRYTPTNRGHHFGRGGRQ